MVEAEVEFDYEAVNLDELTLTKGDVIKNIKRMEGGWWEGEVGGRRGMFPDNFVKVIKDKEKEKGSSMKSKTQAPLANGDTASSGMNTPDQDSKVTKREGGSKKRLMRAKVAYSYNPQNDDELELVVNETVEVLNQPEEGWWEGIINGKQGMFPSNFVNIIKDDDVPEGRPEASGSSAATGASTIPAEEERPPKTKIKSSGMGFGNIFQSGQPHLRKTPAPSKDMSLRKDQAGADKNAAEEKRKVEESEKEKSKTEKDHTDDSAKGICRVRVIFDYDPKNADELHLRKGDIVVVLDKDAGDSGWWRGELNGKEGVFPDNFTEEIPPEDKLKKKTPTPGPARPTSGPARPLSGEQPPLLPRPTRPISGEQKGAVPPKSSIAKQSSQDGPKVPGKESATNGQQRHVPAGARQVLPPPSKRPPLLSKPSAAKVHNKTADSLDTSKDSSDSGKADAKESTFDDIKPSSEKLTHLNLSRPKAVGNRRPPSTVGSPGVQPVSNTSTPLATSPLAISSPTWGDNVDGPSPATITSPQPDEPMKPPPWSRDIKKSLRKPPMQLPSQDKSPSSDSAPPADTPPILPRSKHKKLLQNHTPLSSIPAQAEGPLKTHDVTPPSKSPTQTHPPATIPHSKLQPPDHPPSRLADQTSSSSSSSSSASKEPTPSNEPPWKTELKNRSQKTNISHAGGLQSIENGSAPPGRPKTTPMPSAATSSTTASVVSKLDTSGAPPRPVPISTADPAAAATGVASSAGAAPSGDSAATAELVQDLKKDIKGLHDIIAAMKTEFKKEVKKLMTEVDEEKKHRMMMQVELERIKKLVMEGD